MRLGKIIYHAEFIVYLLLVIGLSMVTLYATGFLLVLGLALTQLILMSIHRIRPYDSGITHFLFARSGNFSFPSDQAKTTFAIAAAFLLHQMRRLGFGFLATALPVTFSRVYVKTHYASDVRGRALTGIVTEAAVRAVYWESTLADRFITNILLEPLE